MRTFDQTRLPPATKLALCVTLLPAVLALGGCSWLTHTPAPPPAPAVPLTNPQVLLLGEVHDNAQGMRERFAELKQRVEAGWRPAIAMEQFDHESQELLSTAQKDCADTSCIVQVMGGPRWDWEQYRAVINLALDYQLPLVAANLSRADASRVVRDGFATTFDAATRAAYQLDALPADIVAAQGKEIVASHCDMLPDAMVPGMVNAQIARDVWMAKLIREQQPRAVVLLAGNGHVRKDIGVPRWINATAPALSVESVAYAERGTAVASGAYDKVRLVKPQERSDPCARFKPKK